MKEEDKTNKHQAGKRGDNIVHEKIFYTREYETLNRWSVKE